MRLISHREDLRLVSFELEKVCKRGLEGIGEAERFLLLWNLNLNVLFFVEVSFFLLFKLTA